VFLPQATRSRPKLARFEIQEGTSTRNDRGGEEEEEEEEEEGSTKLWQVEDGRPPRRSASPSSAPPSSAPPAGIRYRVTRVAGAEIEGDESFYVRARSHECGSVQSTQIILPRVHCLRTYGDAYRRAVLPSQFASGGRTRAR